MRESIPGLNFSQKEQKWKAELWLGGKRVLVGMYSDYDEAKTALRIAEKEHYGDETAMVKAIAR